jgi:hypothetical protein
VQIAAEFSTLMDTVLEIYRGLDQLGDLTWRARKVSGAGRHAGGGDCQSPPGQEPVLQDRSPLRPAENAWGERTASPAGAA